MDRNWKSLADKLPKQPCNDLMDGVLSDIYDGGDCLGAGFLLFHREAVTLMDEVRELMTPEDWSRLEKSKKRRWGARCTCTNCGEDFIAGYSHGGIVLAEGPDGETYDGYVEPGPNTRMFFDGEATICPHCWTELEVMRRSKLRSGRTLQCLQAEVTNIEDYTVLMYWMVRRYFDSTGGDTTQFLPHAALLVDAEGQLRRFRAERLSGEVRDVAWIPCSYSRDPMQIPYYSWEAANSHKVGGWTLAYGPDLSGHTGEKTALDKYIGAGGCWPGAYLHVWQKHPQIENLMRQGFDSAVTFEIDSHLDSAMYWRDLNDTPPIPWVDWKEVKPHRMLHMSKTAFREIREKCWGSADAECWDRYRLQIPEADALDFEHCRNLIGCKAIGQLLEKAGCPSRRCAASDRLQKNAAGCRAGGKRGNTLAS